MRRIAALVTGAAIVLEVAGCAQAELSPEAARHQLVDHLRARHEAVLRVRAYRSVRDLLENVTVQPVSGPAQSLTSAVLVGDIIDVAPGRAYTGERPGAPDGEETAFDAEDAIWRSVHLTVRVEELVSGSASSEVTVGVAVDASLPFDEVRTGFLAFGRTVFFLFDSPVFDDANVLGTVEDGALLGQVDDVGRIRFPIMGRDEASQLLAGVDTVEALRRSADGPPQVVLLDASGAPVVP